MPPVVIAPNRWREVSEAFEVAYLLPPAERNAYVDRECDLEIGPALRQLLELDGLAGEFLERPVFRIIPDSTAPPVDVFSPDQVVADRFRIIGLIGRGGMGEVYEAEDRVLGERVALKAMRADVGGRADASRFLTEAQLARRVSHHGVCRVHDVAVQALGDGGSAIVITMELLKGETLSARLRRGPLDLEQVAHIAGALADALDAAHRLGIVHGDIKPGNVQLVPDDGGVRPKLTDFGLATAIGTSDDAVGALTGTLPYMAPEQLAGGAPSRASDLFSFALLIHDMATGARPARHPDHSVDVATIAPTLPARWRAALERGLQAEPIARFPNATDLVHALTGARTWQARARRHFRQHSHAWTAAGLAVALVLGPLRLYWRARPSIAPSSVVVITDVANNSAEPDLDGATEILRSQLVQSTQFDVMSADRVAAVLVQMQHPGAGRIDATAAREVAMRTGAPLVVRSAIDRNGGGYDVSLTIERVGARPSVARASWNRTFPAATRDDLFRAFHDGAVWVREMAGEPAADLKTQDRPSSETTTSSWEALQLFDRANSLKSSGRADDAILLLRQALQADPEFAMANTRLADLLMSQKRDQEGLSIWSTALKMLERTQLTSREHLRIRGQYLEDTGDLRGAETAYRTYVLHYDSDPDAAFFLASTLAGLGRTQEAVPLFERAASLRPAWTVPLVHAARAYLELGDASRFDATIVRLRDARAGDWAAWLTALRRWAERDSAGALRALEVLNTSADSQWRSRAFTIRASWYAEDGQWSTARTELQKGILFDQQNGLVDRETDKWLHLADVSRRSGREGEPLEFVSRALEQGSTGRRLQLGGMILARAGAYVEAERLLARLRAEPVVPRSAIQIGRLEGELLIGRRRAREAVTLLDNATSMDRVQADHTSLARALMAAGDRQRALTVLRDVLNHPGRMYSGPEPALPAPRAEAAALLEELNRTPTTTHR